MATTKSETIGTTKKKTTTKAKETTKTTDNERIEMLEKQLAMITELLMQQSQTQSEVKEEAKATINNEAVKPTKFNKVMLADESIAKDFVNVESIVDNLVFKSPKTGVVYKWRNKGDIEPMTISEVRAMEQSSSRFLHTPWAIVHDDRVIQAFKLENIMEAIEKVKDAKKLCSLSEDELTSVFKILPNDFKSSFANEVLGMILGGEIVDIGTISILEKVLDTSFKDYILKK